MAGVEHQDLKAATQGKPGRERTDESSSRLQLKRSIAGLPYSEQIRVLSPTPSAQYHPPVDSGPVQTAGGSADASTVKQVAASGLKESGGSLPHLGKIQQSFGHHDVSGVSAHVGGAAEKASKAMGASAYASGNNVAFKASPDLHTAAHEAAHVVQQRHGVSLPGGVGKAGDSYEKHADSVADRVVQGQSAAHLLDGMSGGSSGTVQMKASTSSGTSSSTSGSTSSGTSSSASSSAPKKSGPGGPPAEGWPEESYTEAGGVQHRLFIKAEGNKTTVMQNPSPTPTQIASSSRNTFDLAKSVQTKTEAYILMPDTTPDEKKARKSKLAIIRREMTYLKAAMAKARGEHIPLVNLRKSFEKELGTKCWDGGGEFSIGKTETDNAILEALNMIRKTFEPSAADATTIKGAFDKLAKSSKFRAMISKLGTDLTKGYAGAVGTEYTALKSAFIGGNTDMKIVHLHNFATSFFCKEMANQRSETYKRVRDKMGPTDPWFLNMKAKIDAGMSDKKLVEFSDKDPAGYGKAKKDDPNTGRGMDTKRPSQPVANLSGTQLDHLARSKGVDLSGCTTDDDKRVKLINGRATVSGGGRGGDAEAFVGDLDAGYCQGIIDNIVDGDNWWIKEAQALKMPLTSGISGTTRRVLGVCVPLRVNPVNVRVTMLGQCIKINMHSFHETMAASVGFPNCAYDPGKYIPFSPIADDTLKKIAKEVVEKDPTFSKDVTGKTDTEKQAERLLGLI